MTMNVPLDMNQKKILNILAKEAINNSGATVKMVKDENIINQYKLIRRNI